MKRFRGLLLLLAAATVLLVAPFAGMEFLTPARLLHDDLARTIFLDLRLPRVLTAFLAGGGLALCGLVFQALFRNALADPFTLGIASGSSFGAAAVILLGLGGSLLGVSAVAAGAFAGAALSTLLVCGLASLRRTTSGDTLLLAGIAVSFLFSSLLMFLQYLSSLRDSFHIVRWLMGGIEVFRFAPLLAMLPWLAAGGAVIALHLPHLDQLLAGEDLAHSRGVPVRRTKNLLLAATTVTVGAIVATCGPIGFVGLMTPHVCKLLWPMNHRRLAPRVFLAGGLFLVLCDTAARTLVAPAEIPVGVITALLGGPFFLWLLFRRPTPRQ
ncbi:MAG: iron ABC transporter permease [Lentisphaeria bacterium]